MQVSQQANAHEDDAYADHDGDEDDGEGDDMDCAIRLKMKGKKCARLSTKAAESNKPSIGGSLSDSMHERLARCRVGEDTEADLDVLVLASQGHTDDTSAIEEDFRTIRGMV